MTRFVNATYLVNRMVHLNDVLGPGVVFIDVESRLTLEYVL